MYRNRALSPEATRAFLLEFRQQWRSQPAAGDCTHATGGHAPRVGSTVRAEDFLAQTVACEVGRHVHRLIAGVADGSVVDRQAVACRMLDKAPVDGAVRASVLFALLSATAVYAERLFPLEADLIGVEVTLTGCRADLVWRHSTGQVAIDELKWSAASARLTKQIVALVQSGSARWGGDFVGVRRCPLQRADQTVLFSGSERPKRSSLPTWLEVR